MSDPNVLLVDDEPNVLRSLRRLLRREPINLDAVTSPVEALQRVEDEPYAVVVADQRMPEMEGTELLERIQAASPDTVRIILTGYADMQAAVDAINRGAVYRFLSKPWEDDELRQTLRQAVERYQLVEENRRLHQLTEAQNAKLKKWNDTLKGKVYERTHEIVTANQQLERSLSQSIRVIAQLVTMHSEELGSHSHRVAQAATAVAQQLGLDSDKTRDIATAALLHDIGKVRLPRTAHVKAAHALPLEQRRQLLEHPMLGEAMVKAIPHLHAAATMIRHHHEHFDGTGYPDVLEGDDIPLGARIIAVANAYDNELNGRRSHVWNVPHQAVEAVRRRAPSEFDPHLVEVLAESVLDEEELEAYARSRPDPAPQQVEVPQTVDSESEPSPDEFEIDIRMLSLGMVLARELRDMSDRLLLPAGAVVDEKNLERIHHHHHRAPVRGSIYVKRPAADEDREQE